MRLRTATPAPTTRRAVRAQRRARSRTLFLTGAGTAALVAATAIFTPAAASALFPAEPATATSLTATTVIAAHRDAALDDAGPLASLRLPADGSPVATASLSTADTPKADERAAAAQAAAEKAAKAIAALKEAAEKKAAEKKAAAERAAAAKKAAAAASTRPSGAAANPTGARAIGRDLAASIYGWGADQFSCLDRLWQRESGWNYKAYNSGSGATGIPQALPGSKMASAGSDWATNPATQIKWGLKYIKGRYGSPCGAWNHSQSVGWY